MFETGVLLLGQPVLLFWCKLKRIFPCCSRQEECLHRLHYKGESEFVSRSLFLPFLKLLKQSQFLLNFLAQERHLKPKHLECVWNAAQV